MHRRKLIKILAVSVGFLLVLLIVAGLWMRNEIRKFESNDPLVWKKEIRKFKKLDKKTEYPENAVLFVGGSSIRFWNSLRTFYVVKQGFLSFFPKLLLSGNVNLREVVLLIFEGSIFDKNDKGNLKFPLSSNHRCKVHHRSSFCKNKFNYFLAIKFGYILEYPG